MLLIVFSPFARRAMFELVSLADVSAFDSQCRNTSGTFFGTTNGVADFGSGLNFAKTVGF
jgi:hypothetical protein